MIFPPRLKQLPFELMAWGGAGLAVGYLSNGSAKACAALGTVIALANHVLFYAVRAVVKNPISQRTIYTVTNAIVMTIGILAARHLELIAKRTAGALLFLNAVVFTLRLRMCVNLPNERSLDDDRQRPIDKPRQRLFDESDDEPII